MARPGQLVGLPRARWSDQPTGVSWETLPRRRWLAEPYTRTPVDGVRWMTAWRKCQGHVVHGTRVARLMRVMGLEAIDPKPRPSPRAPAQRG